MSIKSRQDISTHEKLIDEVIKFKEVFCCILYRTTEKPRIEITAYHSFDFYEPTAKVDIERVPCIDYRRKKSSSCDAYILIYKLKKGHIWEQRV